MNRSSQSYLRQVGTLGTQDAEDHTAARPRPASEGQPARGRFSGDWRGPAKNERRARSQAAGGLLVVLVPRTQSSVTARVCPGVDDQKITHISSMMGCREAVTRFRIATTDSGFTWLARMSRSGCLVMRREISRDLSRSGSTRAARTREIRLSTGTDVEGESILGRVCSVRG